MRYKRHYEKWLITKREYLLHLENELREKGEDHEKTLTIKDEIKRINRHHVNTMNRKQ